MEPQSTLPGWYSYVFLGTHGNVIALEQTTGKTVWQTSLPDTGYSVVSILVENGRLLCASGGRCFALDPGNGQILWNNGLPGLGHDLVYLSTANSSSTEGLLTVLKAQKARDAAAAAAASA